MKKLIIAGMLCAVAMMMTPAQAQETEDHYHAGHMHAHLHTEPYHAEAELLEMAAAAGATTEEKVALFDAYTDYKQTVGAALNEIASINEKLGTGAGDASHLTRLMELDQSIVDAREATIDAVSGALAPGDQARAYAFLFMAHIPPMEGDAPAAGEDMAAEEEAGEKSVDEMVMDVAETWGNAIAEGDIDTVMAQFSEDFDHYEYGDKAGLQEFLQMAVDMGYTEDLEIFLDDTEIEMDGDEAIVYPIDVSAAFGSATFEFILVEEAGEWKIIDMMIEGI